MDEVVVRRVTYRGHDGLELAGDAWGDLAAPPCCVSSRWRAQTRHTWRNTARALGERGWCAVSMNLRGHGESGWASDAGDLPEDFVSDLRKVVETFD